MYLKGKVEREKGRDGEIFHSWIHFPNDNSQGWASQEPGTFPRSPALVQRPKDVGNISLERQIYRVGETEEIFHLLVHS